MLAVFGGSKDTGFNKEISDLLGTVRVTRTTWQHGARGGRTSAGDDMLILRPEEIRQLPERHALVVAENTRPILARLRRSIDGKPGRSLLARQRDLRAHLTLSAPDGEATRAEAALVAARERGLIDE